MSENKEEGRPLWGNCLIRTIELPLRSKGGIELPDNAPRGNTRIGKVIAIGSGSIALDGSPIPMRVEAGQTVAFRTYEAEEILLNGEKNYIVDQRQIMYIYG